MLEQVVKDLTATMAANNALLEQLIKTGAVPQVVTDKPAPEKKTKAKKAAPKAEKPVEEPTKAEAEEVPSFEDVQAAVVDYATKYGRPATKKLLASFGATKLGQTNGDLSDDKFAAVIAATKIAPSDDE